MYSYPDIMNFIAEATRVQSQTAKILLKDEYNDEKDNDDVNEFTCLATKLDEYIKRVDEKTFKSIFSNGCSLDKKKVKKIYDIVNW